MSDCPLFCLAPPVGTGTVAAHLGIPGTYHGFTMIGSHVSRKRLNTQRHTFSGRLFLPDAELNTLHTLPSQCVCKVVVAFPILPVRTEAQKDKVISMLKATQRGPRTV